MNDLISEISINYDNLTKKEIEAAYRGLVTIKEGKSILLKSLRTSIEYKMYDEDVQSVFSRNYSRFTRMMAFENLKELDVDVIDDETIKAALFRARAETNIVISKLGKLSSSSSNTEISATLRTFNEILGDEVPMIDEMLSAIS